MNEDLARTLLSLASTFAACQLWTGEAVADGFDVSWFVTRIPGSFGITSRILVAGLLLVADYCLNLIVIALPATRCGVSLKVTARDLIWFTILAQFADRLGMLACVLVVLCIEVVIPGRTTMASVAAGVPYMLVLNFLTSGGLVWILAYYYIVDRWNVGERKAIWIASGAAVFTNPAWAIGFLLVQRW